MKPPNKETLQLLFFLNFSELLLFFLKFLIFLNYLEFFFTALHMLHSIGVKGHGKEKLAPKES